MSNNIYPKTTYACDAFYRSMLGQEITITINQIGSDTYRLHQCDQYNIVVETEDGRFLLVSKSHIIAAEALDTALPAFHEAIADGVKQIQYKASKPRTEANRNKFHKPRPQFSRPQYNEGPREQKTVDVIIKPKRTFDR